MRTVMIARGQDVESQQERCMEYAKKKGYDVLAVTESVYNIFQPILNNDVDVVFTSDMSRITRNQEEYYKIKKILDDNGVELVIVPKREVKQLSYEETIEIMNKYRKKLFKELFELDDMFFAVRYTKRILKELKENPYNDDWDCELLDQQAKDDYLNGRV